VKEQRLWFAGAVEALRDCPVRTTDDVVVREPATGRGLSRHAAIARNTAAARTVEFSCTEDVGDDRSSLAPQGHGDDRRLPKHDRARRVPIEAARVARWPPAGCD